MVIGIVLIAYSLGAMVGIAMDLMTCVNVTPLWHFSAMVGVAVCLCGYCGGYSCLLCLAG